MFVRKSEAIQIAETVNPAEATTEQVNTVTMEYNRAVSVPYLGSTQVASALDGWVSDANAAQNNNG